MRPTRLQRGLNSSVICFIERFNRKPLKPPSGEGLERYLNCKNIKQTLKSHPNKVEGTFRSLVGLSLQRNEQQIKLFLLISF